MGRKRIQAINKLAENMSAISGSKPGPGFQCADVRRRREGHKIITEVAIDLGCTGSHIASSTTDNDIIGAVGIDGAYICQLNAETSGYITYVEMACLEAPADAEPDIDLVMIHAHASGAMDDAHTDMESTSLIASNADWTLGRVDHYAVGHGTTLDLGSEGAYLYLANGVNADPGTYSAGKFVITIEGYRVNDDQ